MKNECLQFNPYISVSHKEYKSIDTNKFKIVNPRPCSTLWIRYKDSFRPLSNTTEYRENYDKDIPFIEEPEENYTKFTPTYYKAYRDSNYLTKILHLVPCSELRNNIYLNRCISSYQKEFCSKVSHPRKEMIELVADDKLRALGPSPFPENSYPEKRYSNDSKNDCHCDVPNKGFKKTLPPLTKEEKIERKKEEINWTRPRYQPDFPRHSYDNTIDYQTPLAYSFVSLNSKNDSPTMDTYNRMGMNMESFPKTGNSMYDKAINKEAENLMKYKYYSKVNLMTRRTKKPGWGPPIGFEKINNKPKKNEECLPPGRCLKKTSK